MKRLRLVATAVSIIAVASAADLECAIGWGKGGTHMVSQEQINDGYCDCPLDGADEPNTNACSGSTMGAFTGIPAVSLESKKYQCPQQRKLQIPYSRFHDGICDCCDGSDELPSVCPDICDQVLAEERALQEKMAQEFSIGQEMRQKEIEVFQRVLKEKEGEKSRVDEQLEEAKEKVVEVESELNQVKHEYMQQRVDRTAGISQRVAGEDADRAAAANDSFVGLLEPLSNNEIVELIVHSCQMAGEMDRASDLDESTCVPLRLAGVDAALLWSREEDGKAELKRLHTNVREEGKVLADLMIHNAKTDDDQDKHFFEDDRRHKKKHRKRQKKRNRHGRRRLQAITDDDILHDDFYNDDAYPDDYIDDPDEVMREGDSGDEEDQRREEEEEEEESSNVANSDAAAEEEEPDLEKSIFETLKESLFAQPRVAFLQRSLEIVDGIDAWLKDNDEEDKNAEGEEDSSPGEEKAINPAAYNMVKSTLEDREVAIERGYDFAVSAMILLKSLFGSTEDEERLRQDLLSLAVGTLVYGKLSAAHVWQILQAILSEFNQAAADPDSKGKTCATSPWVASCPPRAISRESVSFPPQQIIQAAQALCTTPTFTKEKAEACAADADNELPTVMPDGYYGYEVVQPRDDNDVLNKIAAEWDAPIDEAAKSHLDELEDKIKELKDEQKQIENSLDEIAVLVEGAKESRYGIDGELYALKDECFSVKAGKYTYEVCVFGSAAQKEGEAQSGTGLGQWEGVDYEENTGSRILKWTNGVKCWNGPKRSATAFVTCGAETKVLSADEPDTCRYVLKMESHIACDDSFRQLHDL